MSSSTALALAVALTSFAWHPPSAAQTVAGTITDSLSAAPIRGVLVEVVDTSGSRVRATLSDSAGRFRFDVELGRSILRAEAVGYADAATRFQLEPGEERTLDLRLSRRTLILPASGGPAERTCHLQADTATSVAAVWGELQKMLRIAHWSADEPGLALVTRRYVRTVGATPEQRRFEPDQEWVDTVGGRAGAPAITVIRAREGRSEPMREDTAEVGVVDAGLMLSDDFVESHCFSLSRANGRTRLDFLPARSGAKGEKGGSFWLDAAALTLQQVDMKWNARGPIKGRGTQATLELTRTAEGYVIVRRWVVRVWDPFSRHVKEAGGEVVRWWIEGP